METVEIPIFSPVYKGIGEEELRDQNHVAENCYYDANGVLKTRPGVRPLWYQRYANTKTVQVIGYWPNKRMMMTAVEWDSYGDPMGQPHDYAIYGMLYDAGFANADYIINDDNTYDANETSDWDVQYIGDYTGTAGMRNSVLYWPTALDLYGQPITYTYNEDDFFFASGKNIFRFNYESAEWYEVADTDAPTNVSHLGFIDTYIMAFEKDTDQFYWSDITPEEGTTHSWNALSFASSGGSPDLIQGAIIFEREIFIFGQNTVEIWEDDGVAPFSRVPGGLRETGCSAPWAIATNTDYVFFFNHNRKFCAMNGRKIEQMDTAYDTEWAAYSKTQWERTRMYRIFLEGQEYMMIMLEDKHLLFNVKTSHITEFLSSSFTNKNEAVTQYGVGEQAPPVYNSYAYDPGYNKHVLGFRKSVPVEENTGNAAYGSMLQLDPAWQKDSYHTWNIGAGNAVGHVDWPIQVRLRTGHLDYGTHKMKRSNQIRLRLKRGFADLGSTPQFLVRWRDDGASEWKNWHELSLGDEGESELTVRLHRTGSYRTRQYEFLCNAEVQLVFINAEEDIEVLR